ncbi:MAG: DAK2 domain-containing protein [Actinobacteria bacterium]|nr:DAK2 domain-containing protein [Actinomycetota bacterium]MCL5445833.1 DAK2 domain-containing protein [Actinomycetota bacterium]
MTTKRYLTPSDLIEVISSFHELLRTHEETINRLNVYPVPDGDTGTNMSLTLESVLDELASAGLQPGGSEPSMESVCQAVARGSLMGARGNSGVILSQLLRGFTSVVKGLSELDGVQITEALEVADITAREAVLKPVEGTVLTVARAAAEGARRVVDSWDTTQEHGASSLLGAVVDSAHAAARETLERTPEMLPVLAEAGVVDAGGRGYLLFFDALGHVVGGKFLPSPPAFTVPVRHLASYAAIGESGEGNGFALASGHPQLSVRYEVMHLLEAPDLSIPALKEAWEGIGDSIVVVGGDGLWNCHIHTNDVGGAIEAALDVGRPKNIRVTDLAEQVVEERWVRDVEAASATAAPVANLVASAVTSVVAVVNGEGIGRIFRSLGVHHHVAGGQSMNPSVAEMLAVVNEVPSPEVIILPNNDNILPVAFQVAELSTKAVEVVPTSGSIEGFAALLEYDPQAGARENVRAMASSARRVFTGEVTMAVREAEGPDGPIKRGDWLALTREGIAFSGDSIYGVAMRLVAELLEEHGGELITLIEGEGARPAITRQLSEWLVENHPGVGLEIHDGGQPLYPYLIGVE